MANHKSYDTSQVYQFILKHKQDNDGNSPSVRNIQSALNLSSTSTVRGALQDLERQGLIELNGGTARNIKVVGGQWTPPTREEDNGQRRSDSNNAV